MKSIKRIKMHFLLIYLPQYSGYRIYHHNSDVRTNTFGFLTKHYSHDILIVPDSSLNLHMVFKNHFLLFLTNLHMTLSIIKLPFKFMQNCTFYMNAGQMAQSTIVQVKVLTPQHGYDKRINLVTTQLRGYLVP